MSPKFNNHNERGKQICKKKEKVTKKMERKGIKTHHDDDYDSYCMIIIAIILSWYCWIEREQKKSKVSS